MDCDATTSWELGGEVRCRSSILINLTLLVSLTTNATLN